MAQTVLAAANQVAKVFLGGIKAGTLAIRSKALGQAAMENPLQEEEPPPKITGV